jgi:choline dehydrogenase-like flavoprotein
MDADAVIVGAGIAGGLIGHRLAGHGMKVLILEGGPDITRAEFHARFLERRGYSPVGLDPKSSYAPTTDPDDPDSYLINVGSQRYNCYMTKAVGGTTWHWTGRCARFDDDDFKLRSTHGVGVDWPISYADIEPYYVEAEHALGVSAPSSGTEAQRRSRPTPMQDFAWPYFYKLLEKSLSPHGLVIETGGFARNVREYDGRPACRGNNTCWPICPVGAHYGGIVHVDKARELGVEIRPQSLVTRLEIHDDRRIASAWYRRPDGSSKQVSAKVFVIAANGLETAKILLASAGEAQAAGIANSSGQVGRNFMDHVTVLTKLTAREPVFPGRGPVSFGFLRQSADKGYRSERAASYVTIDNRMSVDEIAGQVLSEGLAGEALDAEVRFRAMREFVLFSAVETLPDPDSRISLDWQKRDSAGQPRMRVKFDISDYTQRGLGFAAHMHEEVADKIGTLKRLTLKDSFFGQHPAGATRMGSEARRSVVDSYCRSHDHPNLYIAGSSVFPTQGGANEPTLTIAALALRSADAILAARGHW